MVGFGVSKVILSDHPDFKENDIVTGITSWEIYSVIKGGSGLRKVTNTDIPLSYYVGILGDSLTPHMPVCTLFIWGVVPLLWPHIIEFFSRI